MKYGDRVLWQYTHSTGRARFERVKSGEYLAKARHTVKHWRKNNAVQMAYVKFDGNKTYSLVPFDELRFDYSKIEQE